MTLPELPAGIYRHWKGPLYLVLGYGHDANADTLGELDAETGASFETLEERDGGRDVVVYVGLQLDEAHTGARLAVRTASDFHTQIHPAADETCTWSGYGLPSCGLSLHDHVQRFTYVGSHYQVGMAQ